MHTEMIIAGFGGQGVMLLGKFLAETAMEEGKEVSWLPSYGPEMRGGTANCHVIISEEQVASPVIIEAGILVAMNRPSLVKFEKQLNQNGMIFVNSSIITIEPTVRYKKLYKIPLNEIAHRLGNQKVINMVMAGAIIAVTGIVSKEQIIAVFKENFIGSKAKLVDINIAGLEAGIDYIKKNY